MRNVTIKIGNQAKLEEERLREWREMTPQQRLNEYSALLAEWWPNSESGLKRTYSIVSVPRS